MEEEHVQNINPSTLASRRNKSNKWVTITLDPKITHIVTLIMQVGGTIPISRGAIKKIKGHNILRVFKNHLTNMKRS